MLFGQIGFQCPHDGQVQAGFDCIENMVVHDDGKTELSVRCPKCGTLVRITSHAPIIPPEVIEQLAQELSISMHDGKLNFADMVSQLAGSSDDFGFNLPGEDSCTDCQNLEKNADRELTPSEGNQVEYFARELEKIESVDEFISRINEETR